jgi:hypothetical protein
MKNKVKCKFRSDAVKKLNRIILGGYYEYFKD